MCKNEETNQQEQNVEPTIDPEQVIHREPEMIKEGKETPETNQDSVNDKTAKEQLYLINVQKYCGLQLILNFRKSNNQLKE